MYTFGDIVRFSALDIYSCVITAHASSAPASPGTSFSGHYFGGFNGQGCYFARPDNGAAEDPVIYYRFGNSKSIYPGLGSDFPHPLTGGYMFHYPITASSGPSTAEGVRERGFLPGGMQSLTHRLNTLGTPTLTENLRRVLDPSEVFPRAILVVTTVYSSNDISHFGVDIFGPWR
jgi:hypothetical protein